MGIGEAYGFLYYNGEKGEISKQLVGFKEDEKPPHELSFEVCETGELNTAGDRALEGIVELARQTDLNHTIKATLPGAGNRQAAELTVSAMMWVNGILYKDGEPFRAEVVYKEGKDYVRMQ